MRLRAEQLVTKLKQQDLSPIYCVTGDEPLQILESVDLIRQYAGNNGVDERTILTVDKGFDWAQLRHAGANLSLFSSRRLIELRLGSQKPGREGGAALVDYAAAPDPDNILLITAGKLDRQTQQSKWFKALEKTGTIIQVWPVEPGNLPNWIIQRTRQSGKEISRDAAGLIAQKVEGNLLAARQELDKLCLLVEKKEIDVKDVMDAVSDSARFDVFSMIQIAMQGNTERTIRMLRGLRSEGIEPIAIFGALMWEFRRICSMAYVVDTGMPREKVFAEYRVWQQRKPAVNAILNRLNKKQLSSLLAQASIVDKALKGAIRSNAWELLENFMLRMAGVELQSEVSNKYS